MDWHSVLPYWLAHWCFDQSRGRRVPSSQPRRVPYFDRVLSYATSAPDIARDAYPVTMQQVRRGGQIIPDAHVERFDNDSDLTAFARRVENILPGAYWGLRFV